MNRHSLIALLTCLLLSHLPGLIGWSMAGPGDWYAQLNKPVLNPPNWVFFPVWTLLYTLIGISLYLVWSSRTGYGGAVIRNPYVAFGCQWILNLSWTPVFFGWHSIAGGLVLVVLLFLSVAWTLATFCRIHRPAAGLLIPYWCWVGWATYLNAALLVLNP